jgi:superfamily II DNA or RNA helicase
MVSSLAAVLDVIARAVLGGTDDATVTLAGITLRAHQRDALRRVRAGIARAGGALLADEPGLGKTYVALALAREFSPVIVAAPAALRAMWGEAASRAGADCAFVSLEALSRRDCAAPTPGGLVIVDEAHHACNPATMRYTRLARLVAWRRVLLLSATPVRNRRGELSALLALFMGPRAHTLDDAARSHCIVRRSGNAELLPAVDGPHWHRVRALRGIAGAIRALPPPLPALDGREAGALLAVTLMRCWASSFAALDSALRRRMQRGAALEALLREGRLPTRDELRSWVVGDDAVQLAFPILAAHETGDAGRMLAVLKAHLVAVRALRARIALRVQPDAEWRARLLIDLRRQYAASRVVAFTAHAATAEAVYRALSREAGVALLTARGARTAGGLRPRSDVIAALSGDASATGASGARATATNIRDDISLVVTTDLLSEGVNLQGASVIVHLDTPWTPTGLDQRVGRAARMGSPHACVRVHGIAPPAAAERLLAMGRRLVHKHSEHLRAMRATDDSERLRALVAPWRNEARVTPTLVVAFACARRSGFIAVLDRGGDAVLACGARRGNRQWRMSDAPGDIHDLVKAMHPREKPVEPDAAWIDHGGAFEADARAALSRWLAGRRALEYSGRGDPASRARRALLARIDSTVLKCSAYARASLAARVAHLRSLVGRAVGVAAERALLELAQSTVSDPGDWFTACESRLAEGRARADTSRAEPPVVRALLLLRRFP